MTCKWPENWQNMLQIRLAAFLAEHEADPKYCRLPQRSVCHAYRSMSASNSPTIAQLDLLAITIFFNIRVSTTICDVTERIE